MKITEITATLLSVPLKERFWVSLAPIGGMEPKVEKLLVLESFANPERGPYWPALYSRAPQIVDGQLTRLEEPGLGIAFDPDSVER